MKKFTAFMILAAFFLLFSFVSIAQPPLPPSDPNANGNQQPGNGHQGPVGPGTGLLLLLAAGYGVAKYREVKRNIKV